jgi:hypothetical protein
MINWQKIGINFFAAALSGFTASTTVGIGENNALAVGILNAVIIGAVAALNELRSEIDEPPVKAPSVLASLIL